MLRDPEVRFKIAALLCVATLVVAAALDSIGMRITWLWGLGSVLCAGCAFAQLMGVGVPKRRPKL